MRQSCLRQIRTIPENYRSFSRHFSCSSLNWSLWETKTPNRGFKSIVSNTCGEFDVQTSFAIWHRGHRLIKDSAKTSARYQIGRIVLSERIRCGVITGGLGWCILVAHCLDPHGIGFVSLFEMRVIGKPPRWRKTEVTPTRPDTSSLFTACVPFFNYATDKRSARWPPRGEVGRLSSALIWLTRTRTDWECVCCLSRLG